MNTRKRKYTTTILATALLFSLGGCVKDELHDTPHPDTGKVTVTVDWSDRGEGVDILNGYNGNDTLVGRGGTDTLTDGAGNDKLYGGDGEKIKAGLTAVTRSPGRGYAGCGDVNSLTAAALPVVYAKIKKTYETRTGKVFSFEEDDNAAD